MSQTNTFIRLRQTDILQELIEFLQATKFRGLDKTETIRASLAEMVWQVKQQNGLNADEIEDIIASRKEFKTGKTKTLASSQDIKNFIEVNTTRQSSGDHRVAIDQASVKLS